MTFDYDNEGPRTGLGQKIATAFGATVLAAGGCLWGAVMLLLMLGVPLIILALVVVVIGICGITRERRW